MPISLAILACGCGLIYFGTRGFTTKGIQFSQKITLVGTTAKIVGVACMVAGVVLALIGGGLVVLITVREIRER